MNEQLQAALLSILNSTISAATVAKDFLLAEIPEVIRQLLIWKAVESGIWFGLGVVLTALSVFVLTKAVKFWKAGYEKMDAAMFCSVATVLSGGCGICFTFTNLTWLKILIAPKLYLIEYAASLVK